MASITVRPYHCDDHKEVKNLFVWSLKDSIKTGTSFALHTKQMISILIISSVIGLYLTTFWNTVIFVLTLVCLQNLAINVNYNSYLKSHLESDMKDPDLSYWTTHPNVFYVAVNKNGKILGCIAYQKINDFTSEMNRLAVHPGFYRLGIGEQLLQVVINKAKEEGYTSMYLETSIQAVAACKLYEKMGFEYLHDVSADKWILALTGLRIISYVLKL